MSDEPTTDGGVTDPTSGVDTDAPEPEPEPEEPPAVPRGWSERRRGMDPENRRRVMDACAVRTSSGWVTHFVLMMVLSVVIAVMGLSANSAVWRISRGVTVNGEHGARAICTIEPCDGSCQRATCRSDSARMSSSSRTASSGGRPPSFTDKLMEPYVG